MSGLVQDFKLIEAGGKNSLRFRELWRYRDLLYFLVLRDVTVIYKQTILGFAWVIVNPLLSMVIFTFVFSRMAGLGGNGLPYPVFALLGIIPWNYFSTTLNASSTSLIMGANIFTKVYFPRIIIPLTPVLSKLVDLGISLVVLIVMLIIYRVTPNINLLYSPILLVILLFSTAGLGFIFSALAIQYRDVKFAVTFMMPLLMYVAPVIFSANLIKEKLGLTAYYIYACYPVTGVIEGFRQCFAPYQPFDLVFVSISALSAMLVFVIGFIYFRKMESRFADVA